MIELIRLLADDLSAELQKLYPYIAIMGIEISKLLSFANENREGIIYFCQVTVAILTVVRLTFDIKKRHYEHKHKYK